MSDLLRQQLVGMRETAHAIAAMADAILAAMGPAVPDLGACAHPPARRQDTTRMGGPRVYICGDCGAEVRGGLATLDGEA